MKRNIIKKLLKYSRFLYLLTFLIIIISRPSLIYAAPVYDDPNGTYSDDFSGSTGLSSQTGAGVNTATGKVQLRNSSNGYTAPFNTSGYVVTSTIRPLRIAKWANVNLTGTFPEGTEIKLQVYDEGGTIYQDMYLSGNSQGFVTFPVDISTIPPFEWANADLGDKIPQVRLRFTLSTTNTSVTPEIDSITLTWTQTQGDLSASPFDSLSPWPGQYSNDQKGNGLTSYFNSETYPAIRWATEKHIGNMWTPTLFIQRDKIFAVDGWYNGYFHTIDRDTGEILSQTPYGGWGYGTLSENGTFYGNEIGSDLFIAVDTNDSTVKWSYNFKGGHGNSHVAIGDDGTLYTFYYPATGRLNSLYAFNPDSTIKWTVDYTNGEIGDTANASPISINNGVIYYTYYTYNSSNVSTPHSKLVALDSTNGSVLWEYLLEYVYNYAPLVDSDGTIYVRNYYYTPGIENKIWAINPDGTLKWVRSFGNTGRGITDLKLKTNGNLFALYIDSDSLWTGTEHEIDKTNGATVSTKNRGSNFTYQFIDGRGGLYYTAFIDDGDPATNVPYIGYDDINRNLKWKFIYPYQFSQDNLTTIYSFARPRPDERGWVYSGLSKKRYDAEYNSIHPDEYSQTFAMAPWTISSQTSNDKYLPGNQVNFTVTSSMAGTNPVFEQENKVQIIMDNGTKVPLSYDSTNSSGDSVWVGSYTLPSFYPIGVHTYTIEASQSYLQTDIALHFDSPPTQSGNTGITSRNIIDVSYPDKPNQIQIPFMNQKYSNPLVIIPITDSDTETQAVLAIIEPNTFNFNAFLSVKNTLSNNLYPEKINPHGDTKTNIVKSGWAKIILGVNISNKTYWQINNIQEVWYKAYGGDGSYPIIIPELQTKPSILSMSYTDSNLIPPGHPNTKFTESKLKLAHSLDAKTWTIMSTSYVDIQNKTVSAVDKIGGYYMIVGVY